MNRPVEIRRLEFAAWATGFLLAVMTMTVALLGMRIAELEREVDEVKLLRSIDSAASTSKVNLEDGC